MPKKRLKGDFNPRSPHGERPGKSGGRGRPKKISIHAPRTGSDLTFPDFRIRKNNFNPRSPHGERQRFLCRNFLFQPYFNPRSPHGERRIADALGVEDLRISIHAPRTGSDLSGRGLARLAGLFQSTLPARGATSTNYSSRQAIFISIHAPRTGSDAVPAVRLSVSKNFNPRSPHGERQRKVTILSIRIIGFAQKVYHKTVLLRISLAENAVILPKRPRNPVRTSLQKAGGLRFARAIRAARPYSISSPSGA